MDNIEQEINEWKNSSTQVFWGEIAPCDHLIQIYENDNVFLNTLEGFAKSGFLTGDSVIIIATKEHLDKLNDRLTKQGFNINKLAASYQYIPLDAEETLAKFMINHFPDESLFEQYITQIIHFATKGDRKIRAFGEMVAVLWQQGHYDATVRLEHLWCKLHDKKQFSLYCAYPKNGFAQGVSDSLDTICKTHSKVIDGQERASTEIYYRASC
jgi:hypothetical protein